MKIILYSLVLVLVILAVIGAPQTRASHGDADEPTFCPVHHVPLMRGRVEIVYGLIVDVCDRDLAEAAEKYFPYANSVVYGGCLSPVDPPHLKEVLYCPKCRELEKTWPCLETRETPIITTLPPPRVIKPPTGP